jgi:hypothetical protein
MTIMHDDGYLELSERAYFFQGGLGLDLDGNKMIQDVAYDPNTPDDETHIESTVPWCFRWGEDEWKNPKKPL